MTMQLDASSAAMDDGFTFAEVPPPLAAAAVGPPPMYPVFGRPRSPPPEPETTAAADDSRLPLWRYLMVDQGPPPPPTPPPADDDELDLDGEPPEKAISYLYCPLWPALPAATALSPAMVASPARCRKSGSTGSSLLRWRQRSIGRSRSDGKERFVFFNASSSFSGSGASQHKARGAGEGGGHEDAFSYYANGGSKGGGGGGRRRSFLPYRQDLVGLFANATAFRRSYHPF